MIRLLGFACFVLAAILLVQNDFAAIGDRAQATMRLAQDDSSNAQAPAPASSSDQSDSNDSGKPAGDPD